MADRKTMGEAMALSPERLAFIQSGATAATAPVAEKQQSTRPEKTVEVELGGENEDAAAPKSPASPSPRAVKHSGRGRGSGRPAPQADEVLSHLWMPITTRLQHRTTVALRRATLEQRLQHATPDTQQEIIDLAVQVWLKENGFLE